MDEKRKTQILNICIGVLLIVYIALTTLIFVNHKKIISLEKQQSKNTSRNLSQNTKYQQSTKASEHYQKGDIKSATLYHKNAVEKDPKNSNAHFKLGLLFMAKKGQEHKAIPHFEKVVELEPNNKNKIAIQKWIEDIKSRRKKSLAKMLFSVERSLKNAKSDKKKKLEAAVARLKEEIDKY